MSPLFRPKQQDLQSEPTAGSQVVVSRFFLVSEVSSQDHKLQRSVEQVRDVRSVLVSQAVDTF